MPACPSCGEQVAPGSRFCARCGAAVGVGATETSPIATPTPTPIQYHGRFEPGTRLGTRYRIVGLLGRGGMGEVYRADDLELGQPVALKFLPGSATPAELDRLRREVRIAREISHPNVCRTYDISAADGQAFLVMEYIDGEDLGSVLRRLGRPSRDKAIEIARQLCLGLGAAHERGVLHRDLKPANVMIDGRGRVRITDFGLAAMAEELSADGTVSGTPAYMAPEQLKGSAASTQSDVYALGLILYELFTGKRAYEARDPAEIRRLQSDSSPKSPSSVTPDIDPAVDRVIQRCLEREPHDRPASAYAVLGALPGGDPLAAALAAGETPSPELVASARVEGSVKPAIAFACVLFVLAVFGWWAWSEQGQLKGFTRSGTFLAVRAEEILAKAGAVDPPRYEYGGFQSNDLYVSARARVDSTATAQGRPKRGAETMSLYWRRWTPVPLFSWNLHDPLPRLFYTPQSWPGSATILMEPDGRLILLSVIPRTTADSAQGQALVDWPAFVSAAGYDAARMTRMVPLKHPSVVTDSVTAWIVPSRRPADPPDTLVAGWLGGRIVHVSIGTEWGTSLDPFAFYSPWREDVAQEWVYFIFWCFVPLVFGSYFAIRNLKAGRGDRRGATVLALFVFLAYWISHILIGDVSRDGLAYTLVDLSDRGPIAHSLLHGVTVWILYVALEPYLRRLWPRVLVSWARLITGHSRDPIIGRDILAGFALACATAACLLLARRFLPAPPPSPPYPLYDSLAGPGILMGSVLYSAAIAVLTVMGFFTVLLLARLTLRRNVLAIAVTIVLLGLFFFVPWSQTFGPVQGAVLSVVWTLGMVWVGLRFGFLSVMVGAFVILTVPTVPWTTDLSAWYSGQMLLAVACLGILFAYGLMTALAGRSILKDPMVEEGRG